MTHDYSKLHVNYVYRSLTTHLTVSHDMGKGTASLGYQQTPTEVRPTAMIRWHTHLLSPSLVSTVRTYSRTKKPDLSFKSITAIHAVYTVATAALPNRTLTSVFQTAEMTGKIMPTFS